MPLHVQTAPTLSKGSVSFLHQKTDGCFLTLVRKLPCCRGSLPSCPLASPSSLHCSRSCLHPVLYRQQRRAIHNILKTLKPQFSVDQNPVSFLLVEGSFVSWVQLLEPTGLLVRVLGFSLVLSLQTTAEDGLQSLGPEMAKSLSQKALPGFLPPQGMCCSPQSLMGSPVPLGV